MSYKTSRPEGISRREYDLGVGFLLALRVMGHVRGEVPEEEARSVWEVLRSIANRELTLQEPSDRLMGPLAKAQPARAHQPYDLAQEGIRNDQQRAAAILKTVKEIGR